MKEIHAYRISSVEKKGDRFYEIDDDEILKFYFGTGDVSFPEDWVQMDYLLTEMGFAILRKRTYQRIVEKNGHYFRIEATF